MHLPDSTICPFVLSVGFVFLFAAALVDGVVLAGLGVLVSVVGLVGWFWPQASERIAIDGDRGDARAGGCRSPSSARSRTAGGARWC